MSPDAMITADAPAAPTDEAVLVLPQAPHVEPTVDLRAPLNRETGSARIVHHWVIEGVEARALWAAYQRDYWPLAALAVLRHVDPREQVFALFANPRVVKIVAWQGEEPVGLAMVTNSLEAVEEISPQFLRAHYPVHAARNAIFVAMLVMVGEDARALTMLSQLTSELWKVAADADGVLVFDVCEFNRANFRPDVLARRVQNGVPRPKVKVLDRQTWYVAEMPAGDPAASPAPEAAS